MSYTLSKTADLLILRPVSRDSPGSVSTGETPRQKISKVVAPRDTKVLFRKGNPWEALGIPLDTMNKPSPRRLEQTPSTSSRRPIRPRPKNQIRSTTRQKPQTRRIKNEDQRSKLHTRKLRPEIHGKRPPTNTRHAITARSPVRTTKPHISTVREDRPHTHTPQQPDNRHKPRNRTPRTHTQKTQRQPRCTHTPLKQP